MEVLTSWEKRRNRSSKAKFRRTGYQLILVQRGSHLFLRNEAKPNSMFHLWDKESISARWSLRLRQMRFLATTSLKLPPSTSAWARQTNPQLLCAFFERRDVIPLQMCWSHWRCLYIWVVCGAGRHHHVEGKMLLNSQIDPRAKSPIKVEEWLTNLRRSEINQGTPKNTVLVQPKGESKTPQARWSYIW